MRSPLLLACTAHSPDCLAAAVVGIDISTLSAQDLNKLRTSLTEDVQLITNNYGNLKVAQNRYMQAMDALSDIKEENKGEEYKRIAAHCLLYRNVATAGHTPYSALHDIGIYFLLRSYVCLALSRCCRQAHSRTIDFLDVRPWHSVEHQISVVGCRHRLLCG